MKLNKAIFALLLALLSISVNIFSHEGKLNGASSLKVLKTKYFDIIYPSECSISASLLYENADRIYEKVAENYGFIPKLRFPVVLTPSVENYESYYTGFPYRQIVMYDTAEHDNYSVFSNDFLSKFQNEIAKTYFDTLRDKFWGALGFDFGFLWTTPGLSKGAGAVGEAINGEGVLYDEYFKHIVKQAVIENKFPSFSDVQGQRYVYPEDCYIPFNALFAKYLVDNYGKEKYSKFWLQMINFRAVSVRLTFKNAYGLKLNDVWRDFAKSLEYKTVPSSAFCVTKNQIGSRYTSLQRCDTGVYFVDLSCDGVFFVPNGDFSKKNAAQKVFMLENIRKISVSKDGKFIAASYDSELDYTEKDRVMIFDTETKQCFRMKETSLFENAIFTSSENGKVHYHLVSKRYKNQQYSTEIFSFFLNDDGKIVSVESSAKIDHPYGLYPCEYTESGNGTFACILRENMNYSICIADKNGKLLKKYQTPIEKMVIKQLSATGTKIAFSYSENGSMPRFAFFDTASEKFFLDDNDYSGGVFYPVLLDDETALFAGMFYKKNLIFRQDIKLLHLNEMPQNALVKSTLQNKLPSEIFSENVLQASENAKNYNPLKYYAHVFPLPIISLATMENHEVDYDITYVNPLGFSLFMSSPWSDGKFNVFAGWGYTTNSCILNAEYSGGSDTNVLLYKIKSATEFDGRGWKRSDAKVTLASHLPFSFGHALDISLETMVQYGRKSALVAFSESDLSNPQDVDQKALIWGGPISQGQSCDMRYYLYHHDKLYATYSFLHKIGSGPYDKLGFSFAASFCYCLNMRNPYDFEIFKNSIEQGFELALYFPGFAKNPPKSDIFTYDLPIRFIFSLFPFDLTRAFGSQMAFNNFSKIYQRKQLIFSGFAEFIIFAMEIQKAIPGIQAIYVDNFKISFTMYDFIYDNANTIKSYHIASLPDYCTGGIETQNCFCVGARLELGLGLNFGTFAGNVRGNCYGEILFDVYNSKGSHNGILYQAGIELKY